MFLFLVLQTIFLLQNKINISSTFIICCLSGFIALSANNANAIHTHVVSRDSTYLSTVPKYVLLIQGVATYNLFQNATHPHFKNQICFYCILYSFICHSNLF